MGFAFKHRGSRAKIDDSFSGAMQAHEKGSFAFKALALPRIRS